METHLDQIGELQTAQEGFLGSGFGGFFLTLLYSYQDGRFFAMSLSLNEVVVSSVCDLYAVL